MSLTATRNSYLSDAMTTSLWGRCLVKIEYKPEQADAGLSIPVLAGRSGDSSRYQRLCKYQPQSG